MIVLDTNIVSAAMRSQPDPVILDWLDRQPWDSLWLTTITIFEIKFGIDLMPDGRRRRTLESEFARSLDEDFDRRILPFDARAAVEAGALAATRRRAGRTVEFRDTQIAGIAIVNRATLATRNVRHFEDLPVPIVDPWAD